MHFCINPIGPFPQGRAIKIHVSRAIQEQRSTEFGSRTRHGLGSIRNGQSFEQRRGEAGLHLPSTVSDDAQLRRQLTEVLSKVWAIPSGDKGVGFGQSFCKFRIEYWTCQPFPQKPAPKSGLLPGEKGCE